MLQNPLILDPEANYAKVTEVLTDLDTKMEELHSRAFEYRGYQKHFKVEVTKYEELEEVHSEIKLKQLLWKSLGEWDIVLQQWMEV